MENMNSKKQHMRGPSSSSSSSSSTPNIAVELFGPKESSSSSSSTPASIFGSVFGPPPMVGGRMHPGSLGEQNPNQAGNNIKHANYSAGDENRNKYRHQTIQPCSLSSSIYYGGQEVYPPATTRPASGIQPTVKKDGQDDHDADGNNLHVASRGNWWQGLCFSFHAFPAPFLLLWWWLRPEGERIEEDGGPN